MPKKFTRMFDNSELEELFLSTVKPRNVNQKIFRFKLIQLFLKIKASYCVKERTLCINPLFVCSIEIDFKALVDFFGILMPGLIY